MSKKGVKRIKRTTIGDCDNLASVKGGECLSKVYVNRRTKMMWRCEQGHTWENTYRYMLKGSWCPYCNGRTKTIEDSRDIAATKDGRCLSESYINARTKMRWQCAHGHEWSTTEG